MTLTDQIEALEFALDKITPGDDGWAAERRYALRKALTAVHRAGFEEGHLAGERDVRDARRIEERWAREHGDGDGQ